MGISNHLESQHTLLVKIMRIHFKPSFNTNEGVVKNELNLCMWKRFFFELWKKSLYDITLQAQVYWIDVVPNLMLCINKNIWYRNNDIE